ncbi:hypothetical protein DAETH_09980 [Deinococcus aetherius]|uniref:HTH cro/C1-type domain-containing protein n=1 Tax=Deinococcus aetherius TaxID=200252 RepID=A0ABN6RDS9_9DEIO|nr:helix-turn-helix domain-containing protein [Deinococcus aetherius]BDP41029.1 hypothetical protein DAETH_09980 [Deinococcus aetherius]
MTISHDTLFRVWEAASEAVDGLLAPIETEERHAAALHLLEAVWEAKAEHPKLGSLLGLLSGHIAAYEEAVSPMPASPPYRLLAFLMEQQAVTVVALAQATGIDREELGRLLSGGQELTLAQVRALAEHLHVSPAVFL